MEYVSINWKFVLYGLEDCACSFFFFRSVIVFVRTNLFEVYTGKKTAHSINWKVLFGMAPLLQIFFYLFLHFLLIISFNLFIDAFVDNS